MKNPNHTIWASVFLQTLPWMVWPTLLSPFTADLPIICTAVGVAGLNAGVTD